MVAEDTDDIGRMIEDMEWVMGDTDAFPDVPMNVLENIMRWRNTLKKMKREEKKSIL